VAQPKNTPTPPRLIGAKRVPDEYGIKYTSLRELAHSGEIPFLRVGRAMYFELRDIDRWIESRKETSAA
jgi:excisionase family DNA binding protein